MVIAAAPGVIAWVPIRHMLPASAVKNCLPMEITNDLLTGSIRPGSFVIGSGEMDFTSGVAGELCRPGLPGGSIDGSTLSAEEL